MEHKMRRSDRSLGELQAREIMARAEHGFLATVGEDGWPYGVPVNHVLAGNVLYFHCALAGHKLENLAHEARVCYTAVASAEVVPEETTTLYESAVAFGRARVVDDPAEKRRALELLGNRFCPGLEAKVQEAIRGTGAGTRVVRIDIERITGKSNRPK